MSAKRITLLLFSLAMAAALVLTPIGIGDGDGDSSKPPFSTREIRPGEYTYEQAIAAGLIRREDFARRKGERLCPPLPNPVPGVRGRIPDNAPSCYRPPEEQGIVVLVLPEDDPGFWNPLAHPPSPDRD